MKKTISEHEFLNEFRATRPDNFSYEGLKALFEYLEDFKQDTGEEIELDVIAICCEFSEHSSATEAAENYSDFEIDGEGDEEEAEEKALDFLEERTQVIVFDGGVIIQDF